MGSDQRHYLEGDFKGVEALFRLILNDLDYDSRWTVCRHHSRHSYRPAIFLRPNKSARLTSSSRADRASLALKRIPLFDQARNLRFDLTEELVGIGPYELFVCWRALRRFARQVFGRFVGHFSDGLG